MAFSIYDVSVITQWGGGGVRTAVLLTFCRFPLQVGVSECGVLLSHRAEALDGIHQVLFVHILKTKPVVIG